jgi:hypothetical protein
MSDDDHDESQAIEMHEVARIAANAARTMFNAYLAEGFTEQQALMLVRSWIHGSIGGSAP